MKAVVITDFGAEPLLTDLPVPEPGPREVLVRLRAAALNPFDWKVADGALKGAVEHILPLCSEQLVDGQRVPLEAAARADVLDQVVALAAQGFLQPAVQLL